MYATVTSKGQVTIPAAIREKFGLKPHDRVDFVIDGNEVKMTRVKTLRDFKGMVESNRKLSFEQVRAETKQAVAQRVMEEME